MRTKKKKKNEKIKKRKEKIEKNREIKEKKTKESKKKRKEKKRRKTNEERKKEEKKEKEMKRTSAHTECRQPFFNSSSYVLQSHQLDAIRKKNDPSICIQASQGRVASITIVITINVSLHH